MGRLARRSILVAAAGLLTAACAATTTGRFPALNQPVTPQAPSQAITGDVLGNGSVRVALLIPKSATGNTGAIATALRNSAQLAIGDFPGASLQIMVKDTAGTAAGAQAAAQEAISQGAELILGPLISSSVSAAAPIARGANVPMIAFSTDANVAGPGVYLLSFLPRNDIRRIVAYAANQGRRSFGALLPQGGYGTVAEAAIRAAVPANGGTLIAAETYPLDRVQLVPPAETVARQVASQGDAIIMPDGSAALAVIGPILQSSGVRAPAKMLLGSGQWDGATAKNNPALVGGLYPAPNPGGWNSYRARYSAQFGATPPRIATLAYDAVSLSAALARGPAGRRFSNGVLTNPSGFSGIDGIFRFNRDGTNERGLAILEITGGGATRVVEPAPGRFGAGS
ncbi:MAG: penicillin-binding protein activator [Pseudomonadota bacterium]